MFSRNAIRVVVNCCLLLCILVPAGLVRADDMVTSEPEKTVEVVSTQPVESQPTAEPTDPSSESQSTPEPTDLPVDPTMIEEPTDPQEPTEAVSVSASVESGAPVAVQPAGEPTTDVVDALVENDLTILDENGDPISLASQQAIETLANPDPWIVRGGVTYRFLASCAGYTDSATEKCTTSAAPVQAAIDFAEPNEVVNLGVGVFVEQLSITKSITLLGTSGSVIQSPASLPNSYMVLGTPIHPIIYIGNNASVVVDNLVVDGNARGTGSNYRFMGILVLNANATIQNTNVINMTDPTFGGTQHGIAIYARNTDGVSRTVTIRNSSISNYQKGGIVIGGTGLSANILNNTVTGVGPTGRIAQNGIQIGAGASALISGNTVSGNWYNGGNESVGILLYGAGDVVVDENTLFDNEICVYSDSGRADITKNNMHDCKFGITIYAPGSIQHNVFQNNEQAIYITEQSVPVNYNTFTGNGLNIYYDNETLSPKLDATRNFWGTLDIPTIETTLANLIEGEAYAYPFFNIDLGTPLMDTDSDGVEDSSDNCPLLANPTQVDSDTDGLGNVCDPTANGDSDTDGVDNLADNCPLVANASQLDSDGDGVGDVCEPPAADGTPLVVPPVVSPVDAGIIPITGGLAKLSCAVANTVELSDGKSVTFSGILCDYQVGLQAEPLNAFTPAMQTAEVKENFVDAMTVTLIDPENNALAALPAGIRSSVQFPLPAGSQEQAFRILRWDPAAENGQGAWVELQNLVRTEKTISSVDSYTGTYTLIVQ